MDESETYITGSDGTRLFVRTWAGDSARAVVCIVHGLGEHGGRYGAVAERLIASGFAAAALDLRGHGRSDGVRGHTRGYGAMLDDIAAFTGFASREFPRLPIVLYGQSMGGALTLNFLLRRAPRVAAAVASSPWLLTQMREPSWAVPVAAVLDRLWPSFSVSNRLDARHLSRDESVAQAYSMDRLVHDRISARLFLEARRAGRWAISNAALLKTPTLVMHGLADGLASPDGSRRFAVGAGSLCDLKLWPEMFHELHNEPEKDQVMAHVVSWLALVLAKQANGDAGPQAPWRDAEEPE